MDGCFRAADAATLGGSRRRPVLLTLLRRTLAAVALGCGLPALAADAAPEAGGDAPERDAADEEITVLGKRLLNVEQQRRVYADLAKARRLFATQQVKEAFPYLLNTARHGFKDSQATVGHIYLTGLGDIERDAGQAIGWLGVASSGNSSPVIRNYFNDIWQRLPDRYVPYFEEVVEDFKSRYGESATGVVCDLHRPLDSHVKRLGCFFEDELEDSVRESLNDFRKRREKLDLVEEGLREVELQTIRDQIRNAATNR